MNSCCNLVRLEARGQSNSFKTTTFWSPAFGRDNVHHQQNHISVTCIVNENIQFGFCLQEGLGKGAHRFQTAQIELHVRHISTPSHLFGEEEKTTKNLMF